MVPSVNQMSWCWSINLCSLTVFRSWAVCKKFLYSEFVVVILSLSDNQISSAANFCRIWLALKFPSAVNTWRKTHRFGSPFQFGDKLTPTCGQARQKLPSSPGFGVISCPTRCAYPAHLSFFTHRQSLESWRNSWYRFTTFGKLRLFVTCHNNWKNW